MTASSVTCIEFRSHFRTSSSDKSAIADDFFLSAFGDAKTFPNNDEVCFPPELDELPLIRDEATLERFRKETSYKIHR